jgi:hypothetical protein
MKLGGGNRPRLCENSARYNRTQNFEACGHAQSKKMQKFVRRSTSRPNQFSFSHSLDPGCVKTLPFEACRHAQSKETQKFNLRSALRPNQISYSHGLDRGRSKNGLGSAKMSRAEAAHDAVELELWSLHMKTISIMRS